MVTKSKERNFLTNDWTCTPKVLIMWPIVQFWFSSGSTSKSFAEDRSAHIDATVSLLQKKCIFATETQQFAAKVQSVCKNKKWCAKISRAFVEEWGSDVSLPTPPYALILTFIAFLSKSASLTNTTSGHMITWGFYRTRTWIATVHSIKSFRTSCLLKKREKTHFQAIWF